MKLSPGWSNQRMMVSLILSTLGRSREIDVFLESLAIQEFKNFEVIVIDQNTDDRLVPVVDPARWPYPIKRIHTPDQRGVSRGRNAGLKHAKGDIILFPDDDCWYPPWFLSKAVELLERYSCACLSGRAADEAGRSING